MLHRQVDCGAVALGKRRRSSDLVNCRYSKAPLVIRKHCALHFSTLTDLQATRIPPIYRSQ